MLPFPKPRRCRWRQHLLILTLVLLTAGDQVQLTSPSQPSLQLRPSLTLKRFSEIVGNGYDLLLLSNTNPTDHVQELKNDPSGAMMTWGGWHAPSNLSALLSFTLPEVVLFIPQNHSEIVQTLQSISSVLEQDKGNWKTWKPIFVVQWSFWADERGRDGHSLSSSVSQTELRKTLRKVKGKFPFPLNSDVFIFSSRHWGLAVNAVYEIYTLGNKHQLQRLDLNEAEYYTFSNYFGKAVRRQNFHQALIRPIAFRDPDYLPQVNWERKANGRIELSHCVTTLLFESLQYALNFSTEVIAGSGWSHQEANGSWSGFAAQLQNDEGEVAINLSTFLPYRLRGLDFLHAFERGRIQAFFRQPKARTIRNILISPLEPRLWLSLLAMWTLCITSMTVIYVIRRRFDTVDSCDAEVVTSSFLWVLGTFCQQGWHTSPTSESLKVAFLSGTVFGFVTFVAFSAALVPILSLEIIPIKTLEELGKSKLGLLGDKYLPFVESRLEEVEAYRGAHYLKPKPKDQIVEIDEAIPALVAGKSAFISFTDGFLSVFHRHNHTVADYCNDFYSIPSGEPPPCGFVVKKGSEYKEIFNHKILMMLERGVGIRNWENYQLALMPPCNTKKRSGLGGNTLEIPDVATAYFILGGGILLSLFEIFIEVCLEKFKRKHIQSFFLD